MRVEPPILDLIPKILFEDDKVVVVSKPPYLSVHASGGFLFNSLVGLLRYELGFATELHGKQINYFFSSFYFAVNNLTYACLSAASS